MFSLKKLMGKDDRFFDLLEAGADEAEASVHFFRRYLTDLAEDRPTAGFDEMVRARRKEKRIRTETAEALGRTFVTPLDREDIEALSFALYRIPKQMEKIVERISIIPGRIPCEGLRRQADLLDQAVEAVVFMVKQLRRGANLDRMREAHERLQYAEGEADKLVLGLLRELYHSDEAPKRMFILQQLYEMVEQGVDRCRNAGNVALQVALKNS